MKPRYWGGPGSLGAVGPWEVERNLRLVVFGQWKGLDRIVFVNSEGKKLPGLLGVEERVM